MEGVGQYITLAVIVLILAVCIFGIVRGIRHKTTGLVWSSIALIAFAILAAIVLFVAG